MLVTSSESKPMFMFSEWSSLCTAVFLPACMRKTLTTESMTFMVVTSTGVSMVCSRTVTLLVEVKVVVLRVVAVSTEL